MEHHSDQVCESLDLLDLLFDKTDGILRHEGLGQPNQQLWPVEDPHIMMPIQGSEDFFNVLLDGCDSISGSPVWSPSDSGISEDPHSDHIDSPPPTISPPAEAPNAPSEPQHYNASNTDFPFHFNVWERRFCPDQAAGMCQASETPPTTGFPLTVKDLLLSGTPEPTTQTPQQTFQALVLTEDEKRLLAKEGVTLPNQFPLTKYEERILKKIRRKIRNKQSAQESRKKKKEYIDGLESRMAACSAHNQELQRKVFQLEKCNISLMEQLRRLQALVMNRSNKPAQAGTCVLVLLLSFTLILLPNLRPFTDTKVSQHGDFSPLRVQSRSLHNLQTSRVLRSVDDPSTVAEDTKMLPHFPKEMEDILSLLGRFHRRPDFTNYDTKYPNQSLEQSDHHHHGDPITGHVAAVTLNPHHPHHDSRRSPNADDM